MAHVAVLSVRVRGDVAKGMAAALSVEADAGLPRVRASVGRDGGGVDLRLEAEDPSALRAALNSYLRWADLAARVAHGAEPSRRRGRQRRRSRTTTARAGPARRAGRRRTRSKG